MFNNDNIVFFDGEFTVLSTTGAITFLSMAFIKPSGEELYLELDVPNSEIEDSWFIDNVVPYLTSNKITKNKASGLIKEFIGETENKPTLIADTNQFDWMGICGVFGVWDTPIQFGVWDVPFYYIPVDFASILFARGIDPGADREKLAANLGVNVENFKKHNALSDARVLKEMWYKLDN